MKYLGLLILIALLGYGIHLVMIDPPPVERETIIAKLIELKGTVQRRSFLQATWEDLQQGQDIFDLDEIRTEDKSEALVQFTKDGNKITISQKTTALLKSSSVKVNQGTIENQSSQDNPFNITIGDVEVLFQKQKGVSMQFKGENSFQSIIDLKLKELMKRSNSPKLKNIQEQFSKINHNKKYNPEYQRVWEKLITIEKQIKKDQKVKLTFDEKTNSFKAQVAEGEITLKQADGALIDVKKGQGVLMSKDTGETQTIDLLKAPKKSWPPDQKTLFNDSKFTFHWESISGANIYHLELSDKRDFANILYQTQTSDNHVLIKGLEYGNTYYWQTWAKDKHGFEGEASLLSFKLEEDRTPPKLDVGNIKF